MYAHLIPSQDLLEMARRSGPALPFRQKRPSPSRTPEEREWRTQQRYLKVLREVKEECGDTALSSDEEGECLWALGWLWCLHQRLVVHLEPVVAIYLTAKKPSQLSVGGWMVGLRTPWSSGTETFLLGYPGFKRHLSLGETSPCVTGLSIVGLSGPIVPLERTAFPPTGE